MAADPLAQVKADARKARINTVWEQLNSNGSTKMSSSVLKRSKAGDDKWKYQKSVPGWMVSLGMAPKKPSLINLNINIIQASIEGLDLKMQQEGRSKENDEASEEARKIAAAALAAVKQTSAVGKDRKIEVSEVRQFAGEDVKLRKYVDPNSKEAQMAQEKARMHASSSSGLDALLEKISKKRKLNILDKSRKDWGEFKEEKGTIKVVISTLIRFHFFRKLSYVSLKGRERFAWLSRLGGGLTLKEIRPFRSLKKTSGLVLALFGTQLEETCGIPENGKREAPFFFPYYAL